MQHDLRELQMDPKAFSEALAKARDSDSKRLTQLQNRFQSAKVFDMYAKLRIC